MGTQPPCLCEYWVKRYLARQRLGSPEPSTVDGGLLIVVPGCRRAVQERVGGRELVAELPDCSVREDEVTGPRPDTLSRSPEGTLGQGTGRRRCEGKIRLLAHKQKVPDDEEDEDKEGGASSAEPHGPGFRKKELKNVRHM